MVFPPLIIPWRIKAGAYAMELHYFEKQDVFLRDVAI